MKIYLYSILLLLVVGGCYTQSYLPANEQPLKIHPDYKNYYNEFMEEGEEKLAVSYHYLKTKKSDGTYKLRIFYPETKQILSEETYNKYFVINGKTMKVENTDLSAVNDGMKSASSKRLFSKSMKGRIISRTLLNKFIQEVA